MQAQCRGSIADLFKVVGFLHTIPLGFSSPFIKTVDDLFYRWGVITDMRRLCMRAQTHRQANIHIIIYRCTQDRGLL